MAKRNVVEFIASPARTGKTFYCVKEICDELLPAGVTVYTNLPLHVEAIASWAVDKYKIDPDEVRERIHIIPRDVELSWRNAGRPRVDEETGKRRGNFPCAGPWEYFSDKPLAGSVIIIDEIHNFCGSVGTPKEIANLWQVWLGELGHNQATFRCITQSPEKVHASIKREAGAAYLIRNTGMDRDPYFKILIYDWQELMAGLLNRPYRVFVFLQELQKVEGRAVKGERKLYLMGPPYFDFYDSFNSPIHSAQTSNVVQFEHDYERFLKRGKIIGRLILILWFLDKNIFSLSVRAFFIAGIICLYMFLKSGGLGQVIMSASKAIVGVAQPGQNNSSSEASSSPVVSASPFDRPANSRGSNSGKFPNISGGDSGTKPVPPVRVSKEMEESIQLEMMSYRQELAKKVEELKAVNEKNERMKKSLVELAGLVLISPEYIVLKKGASYGAGDVIKIGIHQGKTVDQIDYKNKEVRLNDGTVLRLGADVDGGL